MAPIAKELDTLSSALAGAGVGSPLAAKPQPAAVEIPVTVNGARTVEGSDKREPFSENTQTVLVFANGAVIRLASGVASGQLLFLTNDKTKKEVVCQVVKSKNYSRESGYVELEFTEAAPGFWGMRFPSAGPVTATPLTAKLASPVSSLPEKSLLEKLGEEKAKTQSAPAKAPDVKANAVAEIAKALPEVILSPVKSLQEKPIEAVRKPQSSSVLEPSQDGGLTPIPASQSVDSGAKVPTLSEFLTMGAKGPELKAQEISAKPEANAEVSAKPVSKEDGTSRDQLSSLILQKKSEPPAVEKKPSVETDPGASELSRLLVPEKKAAQSAVSAPLPAKANPAPGTSTFDFEAEAVKIPAWLEPLARNSAASAAVFETRAPEIKASESKIEETSASSADSHGQSEQRSTGEENPAEYSETHEAVLMLSSEGPTPNFGSSLALDSRFAQQEGAGKSRKGLVLVLLAAGLLLAAAAVWYWYTNQPQPVSASGVAADQTVFASTAPSAPTAAPISRAASSPAANIAANTAGNSNPGSATVSKDNSNTTASAVQPPAEASAPPPQVAAKPSLGNVHLTAPIVKNSARAMDTIATDSGPTLNDNAASGGDPSSLGLLASKGKQPSAPVPVGGDVKQARLISSVAPVYPQLARNQRLSGDVLIDALVDVHGNVSTMKVISGPAMLHQAAMDALRQWKYQPATLNGQAMAMHLSVTVQFKLQ